MNKIIAPKTYAAAFLGSVKKAKRGDEARIVNNFVRVVKRTGGGRRMKDIVRSVEEQLVKENAGRVVKIEAARPLTKKQESEMKSFMKPQDHLEIEIHPDLIAGIRIVIDGEWAIDNTFKRKIEKLFTVSTH